MRKNLIILPLALSLFSCATEKPWNAAENIGRIMLGNVHPITGGHCESSALLNALNYCGYPFTEAQIVGGGGAIGFMYQRGEFPFLGGRNSEMRELFMDAAGLKWTVKKDETAEDSWTGVIEVLQRGLPVVLRVDMRYLPYLYGGKYGSAYMSFGWHMITLFGIDFDKELAYVTDTAKTGLQSIKLADLEKARSSNTKVYPPHREYCWIEKMPEGYTPDWKKMTDLSLKTILKNFEWTPATEAEKALGLGGLNGLKEFEAEIRDFDSRNKNTYLLTPIFEYLYGCIETNGTGGAAFRSFYRDFLLDMAQKTSDARLTEAASLMDACITAWHEVAADFKALSKSLPKAKTTEARAVLYEAASIKINRLYKAEKTLYEYMKSL